MQTRWNRDARLSYTNITGALISDAVSCYTKDKLFFGVLHLCKG